MGDTKLKRAENFLVSAYWNLLKFNSDENEKGGSGNSGNEDALVTKQEIETYTADLHKTFGRLFLAQYASDPHNPNAKKTLDQASDELTKGIYKECKEFGPESYHVCSSYFYLGELFRAYGNTSNARAFYQKIIQIWRKFILENDFEHHMQDFQYSIIDDIYY